MPFNPQATYYGPQLLAQGISKAAQGIGGAIGHFADTADQAAKADALMQYLSQQTDPVTGKPMIDPKSLQAYQNHSQRQRAYLAGGITAGMSLAQALGHYSQATQGQEWQNRVAAAHAAYYQRGNQPTKPFEPTTTVVKDPVTGEYKTFVRTSKSQVKPFAAEKKEPDPIKAAIAEQMKTGATTPAPSPTPAPQPQAQAQAAPVRVNSVAEAQALPAGTLFIDPQGTLRRR